MFNCGGRICVYACACMYICMYVCMYVYVCVCVHTCVCAQKLGVLNDNHYAQKLGLLNDKGKNSESVASTMYLNYRSIVRGGLDCRHTPQHDAK